MNSLLKTYKKIEYFFGNLKFAVLIIGLFSLALAYGTFMESFHGTEYAGRLVYKAWWFFGLQFLMFLSILFATLIRLPIRKNLYGFYVIHSGLIIIFLGSFITYYSGIDGSLILLPNLASREIQVNEDELQITLPAKNKELKLSLPYVAGEQKFNVDHDGIRIKRFLPFAEEKLKWIPLTKGESETASSRYQIYTENFGEFIILSHHQNSSFNSNLQLGPMNVHYLPEALATCFGVKTSHGLIVWNSETGECLSPELKQIKKSTVTGKVLAEVSFKQRNISFFPDMSPLPLDEELKIDHSSPFRIFSKKLFEKGVHVFLFGKSLSYFDKVSKTWKGESFNSQDPVSLPWMGLKLRLIEHRTDAYPAMVPFYSVPTQENGKIISGELKVMEIEVDGKTVWVKSTEPYELDRQGEKVVFELGKKKITLPYELILNNFKMETDPGTKNPASYESFVTLFRGNEGSSQHHVFMNNPLKVDDFTFYQASYFKTGETFGSVLSVNFDPGRPWKYLGSFFLVFGSIWHYFIRRKALAPSAVSSRDPRPQK